MEALTFNLSVALSRSLQYSTAGRSAPTDTTAPQPKPDQLSLSSPDANSAQQTLNQQILASLRQTLENEGITMPTVAEADEFTPDKVAERILGFIRNMMANVADGDERNSMLEKARAGIEQGFSEAREILENLGALNGAVQEGVDRTYALVMQGLDEMAGVAPDDETGAVATGGASLVQYASFESSMQTGLQIQTRDGDVVTVNVSKTAGAKQLSVAADGAAGSVRAYGESQYASASLEYSVQGEIDADEQKAIDHVLKRVKVIAERFENGNINAAMKQVLNMNIDEHELVGFSLSMSHSVTRTAVSMYEQTAQATEQPAPSGPVQQVAGYLGEIGQTMNDPVAQTVLAQPQQTVGDLLLKSIAPDSDTQMTLETGAYSLLKQLVAVMVERFSGEPAQDDDPSDADADDDMAVAA